MTREAKEAAIEFYISRSVHITVINTNYMEVVVTVIIWFKLKMP